MIVLILALVFGLCLCIFNYWFQKDKYKRMTDEELKGKSPANSPGAWLLYAVLLFLALVGTITYNIYVLIMKIMELG